MTAEQTLANRRPSPDPGNDTRLVSIDITSGVVRGCAGRPRREDQSVVRCRATVGYIRKDSEAPGRGIYYTNGTRGPEGRRARGRVVARRHARRVSQAADGAAHDLAEDFSRNPSVRADAHRHPAVVQPLGRTLRDDPSRAPKAILGAGVAVAATGADTYTVIYQDKTRNVLAPQWSPAATRSSSASACSTRSSTASTAVPEARAIARRAARRSRSINPDGSGFREVTQRAEQQRLPVDGAGRQAVRLSHVRARGRRPADHESRDQSGHDADERLRQLPALVAARRSDHVLAPGRRRLRDLHRSSRTAPA